MGAENSTKSFLEKIADRLGPGRLLALVAALFVLDLFVPDPIPMLDEILLGLLTVLAATWKARSSVAPQKPPTKNITPE